MFLLEGIAIPECESAYATAVTKLCHTYTTTDYKCEILHKYYDSCVIYNITWSSVCLLN